MPVTTFLEQHPRVTLQGITHPTASLHGYVSSQWGPEQRCFSSPGKAPFSHACLGVLRFYSNWEQTKHNSKTRSPQESLGGTTLLFRACLSNHPCFCWLFPPRVWSSLPGGLMQLVSKCCIRAVMRLFSQQAEFCPSSSAPDWARSQPLALLSMAGIGHRCNRAGSPGSTGFLSLSLSLQVANLPHSICASHSADPFHSTNHFKAYGLLSSAEQQS